MENRKHLFKQFKKYAVTTLAALIVATGLPISSDLGVTKAFAASNEKTMTVTFDANASQAQNKVVSIPNLQQVTGISVNTGTVSKTVNGNNVTINVNGGQFVSRDSTWNPTYYSKSVSTTLTRSDTSFPTTSPYSDGQGYAGTMNKSGNMNSWVASGSYTAADTIYVSGQGSSWYNYNGYSGTLSQYQSGGSYQSSDSKYVSGYGSSWYNDGSYSGSLSQYVSSGSYTAASSTTASSSCGHTLGGYYDSTGHYVSSYDSGNCPGSMYYSSGGYTGTLYRSGESGSGCPYTGTPGSGCTANFTAYYSGTVGKPASDTRTYAYAGTVYRPGYDTRTYAYAGYVTRPASDTRVYNYSQAYAGTAYLGETVYSNYKYGYTVTMTYVDNRFPIANLQSSGDQHTTKGSTVPVDLKPFFSDADGDVLTYTAVSSDTSVATVAINGAALTATAVKQGTSTVTITANDGKGGTVTNSFLITVDNRNPVLTVTQTNVLIDKLRSASIQGTVSDADGDNVTVSATVNGVKKQVTVPSGAFTLTWANAELTEGSYTSIDVTAVDTFSGSDKKQFTAKIDVDKTAPVDATLVADKTAPTNTDVTVTITYPSDAAVKQFKAGSGAWTAYTAPIVLPANDMITARSQDAAGNWSADKSLTVSNIDKIAPVDATIVADITVPTNTDVKVTVTFPSDAAVKMVQVGNGQWVAYTAPIVVPQNTTIKAKSQDVAGNWSNVAAYDVTNIDKIAPDAPSLKADITNPTNTDVVVSITFPSDAFKKEYKQGNGAWTAYTAPIVIKLNDTIQTRVWDIAGNVSKVASYEVSNIDKIAPTAPKIDVDVDTVTVTPGTDASGIADTLVRINGGDWKSYSSAINLPDGEYTVDAKSVDTVTNETSVTTHFFVYDDTLRDAEVKVSYVERFATAPQSKIDEAQAVVAKLPDVAPEKQPLLDRLTVVLAKSSSATVLADLIKLEREVDMGVADAAKIADWNSRLNASKKLVDAMPAGNEKTTLLDKIKVIGEKIAAIEKIGKSGTGDVEIIDIIGGLPDGALKDRLQKQAENAKALSDAKAKLDALEKNPNWTDEKITKDSIIALSNVIPEKTDLQNRLTKVDDYLKANDAVAKAEQTFSQADYDAAVVAVNKVSNATQKQELTKRLSDIADEVAVVAKVETAESTRKQADVDTARTAVNSLADSELKTKLLDRLSSIDADLINAISKLRAAENQPTANTVRSAEDAISKLIDSPQKQELIDRLNNVKKKLADQNAADKVSSATKLVEQAEQYKRDPYVTDATTAVNALPNGQEKTDLLKRLADLADAMKKADDLAKKQAAEKALADQIAKATDKVAQAEQGKREPFLTDAQTAISALPDGQAKTDLQKRLDDLNEAIRKAKELADKQAADKALADKIAQATQKVVSAEQSKREPYLSDAATAVNALPSGQAKTDLQKRLDDLADAMKNADELAKKQAADKALADLIAEATQKISQAELYKRDPYLTDAQTAVNALPDGQAKTDLQKRLDDLNEAIRKSKEVTEDGGFTPGKDIGQVADTIKDPASKRVYTDWAKAVVRAEKFFARSNITVAIKMMDGVPASVQQNPKYKDLYDEMVKRTGDLKLIYNQLVVDKKLEAATSKATTAVDFFERYPTLSYKQKADDTVNALPDGLIKTSLQKRIAAVTAK